MSQKSECDCGEKSHVGMIVCSICREPFELMFDRRLLKTLHRETMIPGEVCQSCRDKYLKEGCLLINPDTGAFVVMKDSAIRRIFQEDTPEVRQMLSKRIAFADEEMIRFIINASKVVAQATTEG